MTDKKTPAKKAEKPVLHILSRLEDGEEITPAEGGRLVDEYKLAMERRLAADKVAEELKAEEVRIKNCLVHYITKSEVGSIGGKMFSARVEQVDQPTVKDWTKFYAYIHKNKAYDLLEKRPGKAAVKERWDDGKTIPGVEKFPVDVLRVTKL